MMEPLTEARRKELLAQLEHAQTDEEFDAIEAELGLPPDDCRWIVTTLAVVAEFFGVHEQTVKGWRAEGMPGTERAYKLTELAQWRIMKAERRGGSLGDVSERSLIRAERELNCERKRHELDAMQGKLIDKEQALADITEAFAAVRMRLEALPAEMVVAEPADVRDAKLAEWKSKIRLVLQELAAMGQAS